MFGKRYLNPDEEKITGIRFSFEEIDHLVDVEGDSNFESHRKLKSFIGTVGSFEQSYESVRQTSVKDGPYIDIDFVDSPIKSEAAFERMTVIRQFVSWVPGYVPTWKNVRVFTG